MMRLVECMMQSMLWSKGEEAVRPERAVAAENRHDSLVARLVGDGKKEDVPVQKEIHLYP